MCDFSVIAKNQRDYRAGEGLVITQFGPYTRGTASPSDLNTAVCLRSGVCLMIGDLPKAIRTRLDLPSKGEIAGIFMQLPNREENHRDALTFENGRTILLTELPIGLAVTVYDSQPHVTDMQVVGKRTSFVPALARTASRAFASVRR